MKLVHRFKNVDGTTTLKELEIIDADACFESAEAIGKEIVRRWNAADKMPELIKHLTWFMKDNDKRTEWDNEGKEDSPEVAEVRVLLEGLK